MAYATLEILADQVRCDLEDAYETRPAKRSEALLHLLRLLVTAHAPPELEALADSGEIRGLKTHARALESYLQRECQLPEALCARYKYRTSEALARSRHRISRRTWRYFHDLAKELDWNPDLHVPLVSYERLAWHDAMEERFVELEVVLDGQALEGMFIPALEGYLSPRPPRRKGYEVYGINLGMSRETRRKNIRDGIRITRYVSVMRSQPQLSADSRYGFVEPNPRSLQAILGATTALYPQYQAVGDFHSHPYDDLSLLDEMKGWEYTPADEDSNVDLARILRDMGHRILVTFVIGVARSSQHVAPSHYRGMRHTIQTSLGGCRIIVAAYRSLESGRLTRSNIRLRLSGTTSC